MWPGLTCYMSVLWVEWIPESGSQMGGPCACGKNSLEELSFESSGKCPNFRLLVTGVILECSQSRSQKLAPESSVSGGC